MSEKNIIITKILRLLKNKTLIVSVSLALPAGAMGCLLAYQASKGNFRVVVPGKVYRSGQPTEKQLKEWIERYDIKTIINVRGDKSQIVAKETNIANKLPGLKMTTFDLSAHRLPSKGVLLGLVEAIETSPTPILIHCQSGIDRAGTTSALAAMIVGQIPYSRAKWQAYVATGPWKRTTFDNRNYYTNYSHISDLLIYYERYCTKRKLDINDLQHLKEWIADTDRLPEIELE